MCLRLDGIYSNLFSFYCSLNLSTRFSSIGQVMNVLLKQNRNKAERTQKDVTLDTSIGSGWKGQSPTMELVEGTLRVGDAMREREITNLKLPGPVGIV